MALKLANSRSRSVKNSLGASNRIIRAVKLAKTVPFSRVRWNVGRCDEVTHHQKRRQPEKCKGRTEVRPIIIREH